MSKLSSTGLNASIWNRWLSYDHKLPEFLQSSGFVESIKGIVENPPGIPVKKIDADEELKRLNEQVRIRDSVLHMKLQEISRLEEQIAAAFEKEEELSQTITKKKSALDELTAKNKNKHLILKKEEDKYNRMIQMTTNQFSEGLTIFISQISELVNLSIGNHSGLMRLFAPVELYKQFHSKGIDQGRYTTQELETAIMNIIADELVLNANYDQTVIGRKLTTIDDVMAEVRHMAKYTEPDAISLASIDKKMNVMLDWMKSSQRGM